MKLKLLTAAIVGFALLSCNKDFIDKTPKAFISSATYFKTQSDFEQAVNGIYAPLQVLYDGRTTSDNPGIGAWITGEMRSDNTIYIYNSGNRGFTDAEDIDNFLDNPSNGITGSKYDQDYIIIGRANQVLALIDNAQIDDAVKANLKGQALFLRAFCFFDLVQYFGNVPLPLTPANSLAETALPQTVKDSVYLQIIKDAKEAATLLPAKSKQEAGRATLGAAKTLLGNVYVVTKQWASAEAVLKEVETSGEYSLLSNYASLFRTSNKNNSESIFEIQFYQSSVAGLSSNFIYNFLPRLSDPGVVTGLTGSPANNRGGWNTPTPDLIASYETGDKRKEGSISYINGYPYINKYLNPHSVFDYTDDNFPVYRYAEVLLFIAEALNEQGKSAEALIYLNKVHANVRTGLDPVVGTEQSEVREAIANERRVEFAFENKRWTDLVRTGKAIEVMNAQGAKIKANPTAYYFPTGINLTASSYKVDEHRLLFPIPLREIQLNPDLTQNTGY